MGLSHNNRPPKHTLEMCHFYVGDWTLGPLGPHRPQLRQLPLPCHENKMHTIFGSNPIPLGGGKKGPDRSQQLFAGDSHIDSLIFPPV